MATDRIENAQAGRYAAEKKPFLSHNKTLMGDWESGTLYVVHSYGRHFPIYIYDKSVDMWFANTNTASSTTSRHKTHAFPSGLPHHDITWLGLDDMHKIIRAGSYAGYVGKRICDAQPAPVGLAP